MKAYKYLSVVAILLVASEKGIGQSDYNSGIKVNRTTSKSILVPATSEAAINSLNEDQKITNSIYTDGTGKPIQIVIQNNDNNDVIKPVVYDEFDRILIDKLPYISGNNHKFKRNVYSQQYQWNNNKFPEENGFSYSTTVIDDVTLKREVKFQDPGKSSYQFGNSIYSSTSTDLNTNAEGIRIWNASAPNTVPVSTATWMENKLVVKINKDRDGSIKRSYYDKSGKLILDKQSVAVNSNINLHTGWKCTYYIYDVYDRLIQILSPKLIELISNNGWTIQQAEFDELATWFKYDPRNRVIERKNQGIASTMLIYDNQDRLVFSQDGNLRTGNKWLFYKYDITNRLVIEGVYSNSNNLSQTQLQSYLKDETNFNAVLALANSKIINNTFTTSSSITDIEILKLNYYDNYTANAQQFIANSFAGTATNVTLSKTKETKGFRTETFTRLFNGDEMTPNWEHNTLYYDRKRRPIQIQNLNFTNGNDITSINYDFAGKVISTISSVQNASGNDVDISNTNLFQHYFYDKNQLESIFNKFNLDPYHRKVTQLTYDDFGRVIKESLGTVEERNYQYNILGQLLSINKNYYDGLTTDNFFGEKLEYDINNNKSYMPHEILWRQKGSEDIQRKYTYSYDYLKRLTNAEYSQSDNAATWSNSIEDYSVKNMTYDLNGNILSFKRWGTSSAYNQPFLMDDLVFSYLNGGNSNKLNAANDGVSTKYGLGEFTEPGSAATDYTYNADGYAISDANREISTMNYGLFSKPTNVAFNNNSTIKFNYGADFILRSKIIEDTENGVSKRIDYLKGLEYVGHKLKSAQIPNGSARLVNIIDANNNPIKIFEYDYHLKDHFGNVKSVVTESPDANWYQVSGDGYVPVAYAQTSLGSGFTRQNKHYNATFENTNAMQENTLFEMIDEVRDNKPLSTTSNDEFAAKLNLNTTSTGAIKLVRVLSGDNIKVAADYFFEGNGNYDNQTAAGVNDVIGSVLNTLTGTLGVTAVEGTQRNMISNLETGLWDGLINEITNTNPPDPGKPYSFLNVLFFDDKFQLDQNLSKRIQIEEADNWYQLNTELNTNKNGYFLVFVNNQTIGDVYFDNVEITHEKGALLQESHYYPYGLTISSAPYTIINENNSLFLGKQLEKGEFGDNGLNLYNFDYRLYDPQIGRFHAADPLAAIAPSWSPYRYGFNNPMVFSDPSGLLENMPSEYDCPPDDRDDDRRDIEDIFYQDVLPFALESLDKVGNWLVDQTGTAALDEYESLTLDEDNHYDASSEGSLAENFNDYENNGQSNEGGYPDRTHDRPFGRGDYGENKGQTWYYMYRMTGNAHAMAYDPVNKVVYDINSWRDEDGQQISVLDRLWEHPLGDLSVAYEYHQNNPKEWAMLSEREAGEKWALAPFYLPDPAAATAWFQSHTGKSWGYAAGFNNCSIYAMDGLEAGGANIHHVNLNPAPSSVNSKSTIYWQFPAKK